MGQTTDVNAPAVQAAGLHPAAGVGAVTLKVAELDRSLRFYTEQIGLWILNQDGQTAILGSGNRPVLKLLETPGARPQPPGTTGLYHAAILFPDRHALAVKIAQLSANRVPFGYSDHLVSEAFYLSDPDGNGLELYRDRPRSEWGWLKDQVRMANAPIDFESFFGEIQEGDQALAEPAAPSGTRLGHMHLRVANLAQGEQFYHGAIGFDITARMPGALFLSAGGYHHHLGMNTWESLGGKPPAEPSAGLEEFSITLPDRAELERVAGRVEAAGFPVERGDDSVALDPFQNRVRLVVQEQRPS
jgi:catechol 2,3-dioxygenase